MSDQPLRALSYWPGLSGLWLRGHLPSLMLAVGFSVCLNIALLSTFVWPSLLGTSFKVLIWPLLLATWGVCIWQGLRQPKNELEPASSPGSGDFEPSNGNDTLFSQAQTEYLKGDFTLVELLLTQILQTNPRDAESRLLLATTFRRTDRPEKADQQLDKLEKIDESKQWRYEIKRERQLIQNQDIHQVKEVEENGREIDRPRSDVADGVSPSVPIRTESQAGVVLGEARIRSEDSDSGIQSLSRFEEQQNEEQRNETQPNNSGQSIRHDRAA